MENQNLNDKYYNIVKSDFRSCRPGLIQLERTYKENDLREMLKLLVKFFVETVDLRRVRIDEISREVPDLMDEAKIFYNYNGVFKISEFEGGGLQEYSFFQDDPDAEIELIVMGCALCKVNMVDCKVKVRTNSTSRTDIYSGGNSEISIELNQSSQVLMVNVDNSNPVEVINSGSGMYHYKEIKINT